LGKLSSIQELLSLLYTFDNTVMMSHFENRHILTVMMSHFISKHISDDATCHVTSVMMSHSS